MVTKVSLEMMEEGVDVAGLVPVGALMPFAGTVAPTGWLFAYGQSLSRTTYAALFATIGTSFGSADGASFNLPDLRGRVAMGRDNMGGTPANRVTSAVAGLNANNLGAGGGSQQLHQHSHGVTDPGHSHAAETVTSSTGPDGLLSPDGVLPVYASTASAVTGISIQNTGSGNAQNIQPSLVLNWIIRAE